MKWRIIFKLVYAFIVVVSILINWRYPENIVINTIQDMVLKDTLTRNEVRTNIKFSLTFSFSLEYTYAILLTSIT